MPIAADYPFLDIFWTMLVFFGWVIWFVLLIRIFGDLFRRHDISGWGKAAWTVFVVFLPFLGVLVYLIAQGTKMAHRDVEHAKATQSEFDTYVKSVAGGNGAAAEIEKAQQLRDSGAITEDEFNALKRKAIAV